MAHRGPDDTGEWWSDDGRIGFGHCRLSIIDLSSAGHQPMCSADHHCTIVFNGEIYNFREIRSALEAKGHSFSSDSDTEVIIAAYLEWGIECLSRLNGMFAFALFDARNAKVFLARDRTGEKPLYYSTADDELRFSSELKGLMADPAFPKRVCADAFDCYLALGFIPGEMSILEGVRKLPPAHALLFDARSATTRVWRYWTLPDARPDGHEIGASEDLLDELESTMRDAVNRQLIADVPVGILLSGGLDSSLVTAFAAQSKPGIKTFTVRFPGHGRFDETEHARLVAKHFSTEHIELEANEATVDVMPLLARQFDEPMADSSMVPTYSVCRVVREHCKVALGGDGGDELFGGYRKYSRYIAMQRRLRLIPNFLLRAAGKFAGSVMPTGMKGRNLLQQSAVDLEMEVPIDGAHFDRISRKRLTGQAPDQRSDVEALWSHRVAQSTDIADRAMRTDFENYLPEKILTKVDRASMINSLEVRAPFLDQALIEFAYSRVPTALKVSTTNRKILLKKLARRMLPETFKSDRKQGFSIPLASWLKSGPWHDYFHEVLTDSSTDSFDKEFVSDLLAGQAKGHANSERLFSLVLFELWRRAHNI